MRMRLLTGLLLGGMFSTGGIAALSADPKLVIEVMAVRAELARSKAGLRPYAWTEQTDVLVKGKVHSSSSFICRYDSAGAITRMPLGAEKEKDNGNAVSKRPMVRKQAARQDDIERAIGRIQTYFPPDPEQIGYLLRDGYASLGKSEAGKSEMKFTHYYEDGDSLVFTYDPVSKVLLRVNVSSTLGSPKDPVTMEAVFETTPDGLNHLSSTNLIAKSKKVQVKSRNSLYQKVAE